MTNKRGKRRPQKPPVQKADNRGQRRAVTLTVIGAMVAGALGITGVSLFGGSDTNAGVGAGLRIGPLKQYALSQKVPALIDPAHKQTPLLVTSPQQVATPDLGLIDSLNKSTALVTGSFAPNGVEAHMTEGLVTPPGAEWWTMVTSVVPSAGLAHAAPPKGAAWYAATTQNNVNGLPGDTTYGAIEIGFESHDAASRYANATVASANGNGSFPAVVGSLVIFAPSWANPNDQPIPKSANGVVFHPKAANWVIDFGRQNAELALSAATPKEQSAMAAIFRDLGFTNDTLWNAMATSPRGPWVGQLQGYDPNSFNFADAGSQITTTTTSVCQGSATSGGGSCVQTNAGLSPILSVACWRAGDEQNGLCDSPNLLPNIAPSKDVILKFGYQPGLLRGVIDGTGSAMSGVVADIQGWITRDANGNYVMTRVMVPGSAPATSQVKG